MPCSRPGPARWLAAAAMLLLLLLALPAPVASAAGSGAGIVTPETAVAEASRLMERVRAGTRANPASASARPGWKGASPGEPLLLHSFDGKPTSWLVPVVGADGATESIIGVRADTGEWAWHSDSSSPAFPRVDRLEAAGRASALLRERGVHGAIGEPTARSAPDKNVYWVFQVDAGPVKRVYVPVFFDGPTSTEIDPGARQAERPGASVAPQGMTVPGPQTTEAGDAGGTVVPPAYPGAAPAAFDIPGVPHHYQETNYWCGPAALEMLFDYWGEDIPQDEIAAVVNAMRSIGCYNADLLRAGHFSDQSTAWADPWLRGYTARGLGYGVAEAEWDSSPATRYSDLKELISRGFPVLVLTYYDPPPSSGHFRLVKGYDDTQNTFIVHDPWFNDPYQGPNVHFNQEFFVDTLWPYSRRWGIIAAPWGVTVAKPTRVAAGQVFQVTASVEYRGPAPMNGQYPVRGDAVATLESDGAYEIVGGAASQAIGGIGATGTSGSTTWTVRSLASQSTTNMRVVAQGLVEGTSFTYSSYSDWIGGMGSAPPPPVPTGRSWGHDSVGVKDASYEWYLAEGCTGAGFETWILVQNPGEAQARVELTYMTPGGQVAGPTATVPAGSRTSFSVAGTLPGEWSVSTRVTSDREVIAERAMYGAGRTWGHDSIGVTGAEREWYLAEGCTSSGFETWILVQNPNPSPTTVELEYMTTSGPVEGPRLRIPANGRHTFFAADTVPDQWSVSTRVTSDKEVIAERAMYGPGRTWGHASIGAAEAARDWYLAEGCTQSGFETWILVQNPNTYAVDVELTYMTSEGPVAGPSVTLQPRTRRTFNAADKVPGEWEVSTSVSASGPVVAERAMYGGGRTWGHASIGAAEAARDWYLAEGCTQSGFETWVLVQNPNGSEVDVELDYMTTGGPVDGPSGTVPAYSRMTFNVADTVPFEWEVSTHVGADDNIIVERAVYGDRL